MCFTNRPVRHLSSHPIHQNSRKYLRILPQFTGIPVHLPVQVFTMIVKVVKLMTLNNGSHTSPKVYLFVDYENHLDLAPVNPLKRYVQTSGFDPMLKVKTCFDCKMFDVSNWVAHLNGEDGPGGRPSHEALQFHLKEH